MRKIVLFFICLLCACQNQMSYSNALQTWVGQSQERLIQSWGAPQNITYLSPNQQLWTYVQVSSKAWGNGREPYAKEIYYPAINMPDFGLPNQPQQTMYYCKTMFTITGNIITDYSFNGDDCVVER